MISAHGCVTVIVQPPPGSDNAMGRPRAVNSGARCEPAAEIPGLSGNDRDLSITFR